MKIAFVAYDRPGYRAGPIVNARRLLPGLVQRGHDVTALILYHEGASPASEYLARQGVRVVATPYPPTTERQMRWMLTHLQALEPDVFVPNHSVSGWFAARWCREAGIPTVAAHRSDEAFYWAMIDQFVVGPQTWAVSGCVCVSDDLLNKVNQLNPRHTKLYRIPSGVPVPETSAAGRRNDEPFRIVYLGRFEDKQKRITETVETLISLLRARADMEVTLFGEGSKEETIRKLISQSAVSSRIVCRGAVAPEVIQSELINHHALVLLSDYEGLPGAVMDAMACGLVPVCSRIDGLEELVVDGQTGCLITDRGAELHRSLCRIADDCDDWKRLSDAARDKVARSYSLEFATTAWENCFDELVSSAGERTAISVPRRFELPPVRSGLAREDVRQSVSGYLLRKSRPAIRTFSRILRKLARRDSALT